MLAAMASRSAPSEAEQIAALHQAARRYCIDEHARWARLYTSQRTSKTAPYSNTDYNLFPRYLVLDGILDEIERWVPAQLASLEEARERLGEAARTGSTALSRNVTHPVGLAAQAEVRADVERFLFESTLAEWLAAAPLPFRRTLGEAEVTALRAAFHARWGTWYAGGCTDRAADALSPHLTVHTEALSELPLARELAAFFARYGIARLFFVPELRRSYEYEPVDEDFDPGSETLWLPRGAAWMIYASHESSLTLGGEPLLSELRAALPTLDAYEYRGWGDLPSARPGAPGRPR